MRRVIQVTNRHSTEVEERMMRDGATGGDARANRLNLEVAVFTYIKMNAIAVAGKVCRRYNGIYCVEGLLYNMLIQKEFGV